jgi:hypothetical protein
LTKYPCNRNHKWSPFSDGENNLPHYPFVFNMDEVCVHFNHPQDLENTLNEIVPNEFCYGFCRSPKTFGASQSIRFSYLAIKDESLAVWIKLQTGCTPIDKSKFQVRMSYYCDTKWEMECV